MLSTFSTFHQALQLAARTGFVRQVAEAQSKLAEIYRERFDLEQTQHFGELAVASTRDSGNAWAVPQCLGTLADIAASRGRYTEADDIYDRADALIDGLLGQYSGVTEKTGLIKASSELYRRHFSLIATRLREPSKAYNVVEEVRGRVLTDLLMAGSVTPKEASSQQRTLSGLRIKLMSARSAAEANNIRNQIFLAQQASDLIGETSR